MAQASHANFVNMYYDDDGWWALAWIDAYDVTGNPAYLSMAETIFTSITGAWDSTCGGGVWWSTARTYKNAIPNELFLTIAAKLANRTSGSASASYLNWAQQEWAWFKNSGMINAQNLINDGLNSSNPNACTNNGGTTWSYNQGVILGGLVELYHADNDPTLLPQAEAIANAAIANLTQSGILTDPGSMSGGDAPQFKGVFLRNLMALYVADPDPRYQAFADANAKSIVASDQGPELRIRRTLAGALRLGRRHAANFCARRAHRRRRDAMRTPQPANFRALAASRGSAQNLRPAWNVAP